MYYGKMTKELEKLYSEYENKFGYNLDGVLDVEYAADEYDDYVNDIEKSLELGVELPDIYPHDDEF